MKIKQRKQNAAAALTLREIDQLVGEIADYQLTVDGMQADLDARYRALDEAKAALASAAQPDLDRITNAQRDLRRALEERVQVVAQWAEAHKADRFTEPRSLKLLRGVIGFRLSPPKVTPLKDWTLALCARALRRRAWGRDFLHPAKIDHEAIIRARAEFEARPSRLAAVGLQITQADVFYCEPLREGSDAYGKEAA